MVQRGEVLSDPEEIAEVRRRYKLEVERRGRGPCAECGMAGTHVTHDPPEYREHSVAHIYGYDYYTEAGVEYHPFVGMVVPEQPRPARLPVGPPDYHRGYQAGYHAGIRAKRRG